MPMALAALARPVVTGLAREGLKTLGGEALKGLIPGQGGDEAQGAGQQQPQGDDSSGALDLV